MRPFDKFKEIDARLAALEAAIDALVNLPSRFPSKPAPGVEIIDGPAQIYADPWPGAVPMEGDDAEPLTTKQFREILDSMSLAAPIVDAKPIASATIAPLPAKRRSRPPKTA